MHEFTIFMYEISAVNLNCNMYFSLVFTWMGSEGLLVLKRLDFVLILLLKLSVIFIIIESCYESYYQQNPSLIWIRLNIYEVFK